MAFVLVVASVGLVAAQNAYPVKSVAIGPLENRSIIYFSVFSDGAIQISTGIGATQIFAIIPDDYLDLVILALVDGNRLTVDTDSLRPIPAGALSKRYTYSGTTYLLEIAAISGSQVRGSSVDRNGRVSFSINDMRFFLLGGDFAGNKYDEISVEELYLRSEDADKSEITSFVEALIEARLVGQMLEDDLRSSGWSKQVLDAFDRIPDEG